MKTGVSTTPWPVVSWPRRAAPSVAVTSNGIYWTGAGEAGPNRGYLSKMVPGSVRRYAIGCPSRNQRGVAVGIESIAGGDGVAVGGEHGVATRERGDQQQQRRARQVEIRQQRVDDAEPMTRPDGDVSDAVERPHAPRLVGGALERAHRRRAHGDHAPALAARAID